MTRESIDKASVAYAHSLKKIASADQATHTGNDARFCRRDL
jgi:hypothetical protein